MGVKRPLAVEIFNLGYHFEASRNKIKSELINQSIINFGIFLSKQKALLSYIESTGVV